MQGFAGNAHAYTWAKDFRGTSPASTIHASTLLLLVLVTVSEICVAILGSITNRGPGDDLNLHRPEGPVNEWFNTTIYYPAACKLAMSLVGPCGDNNHISLSLVL